MEFTEEVYNKNRYLVYKLAWQYVSSGVPFEDLCQVGFIGLGKACKKYKEGYEFSTYAWNKIQGEMRTHIAYKKDIIHIPVAKKSVTKHYYTDIDPTISYETDICITEDLEIALSMLRDDISDLIRLKYYQNISMTEISDQTGISYDAVVYRIEKGLKEMRKYL